MVERGIQMEQSALKTVIMTGGSSGLGLETARKIAADPAFRVVLACRNTSKAERAAAEIQSEIGNGNVLWMELDTACQRQPENVGFRRNEM